MFLSRVGLKCHTHERINRLSMREQSTLISANGIEVERTRVQEVVQHERHFVFTHTFDFVHDNASVEDFGVFSLLVFLLDCCSVRKTRCLRGSRMS